MTSVALSEVAAINPAGPAAGEISPTDPCYFVPMSALREDGQITEPEIRPYAELARGYTPFRDGDILVAKITPCYENNKIGLVHINGGYAFGSTEFHVIRCQQDRLDPTYLTHFLRQDRIRFLGERRMTGSAGQRRVPKAFLEELQVPLPELREQKRIADILNTASDIRRKREQVLLLADEFVRSSFVHMVGFKNPDHTRWNSCTIERLAAPYKGSMRTGPFGSDLRHSEFVDAGVAVLGIDNAVDNRFAWNERRYITNEKFQILKRYQVYPADIIVTIMGTTGRSAVVPDDIPMAVTTKHLATITCDRRMVEPEFLSFAIHSDPLLIGQIKQANKGAIMDGLNLGIIKSLEIHLPPIELQMQFSQLVRTVNRLKQQAETGDGSGTSLFHSLSQRVFRGEL
jgi:type I restriction enzyme S subunit